jgi:hypothetical protein
MNNNLSAQTSSTLASQETWSSGEVENWIIELKNLGWELLANHGADNWGRSKSQKLLVHDDLMI